MTKPMLKSGMSIARSSYSISTGRLRGRLWAATLRFGNVRFGSKADILGRQLECLLYLQIRHSQVRAACPLWAKSGHHPAHSITSSARASSRRQELF
jgi:hypothetical protein